MSINAPEAVRLVIWDLDETFWEGTLTEGGIKQYREDAHSIVIELTKRGIMNSICSKNEYDTTFDILVKSGISEYFIFPSIAWEPKGLRIKQIIEQVQLRNETVLFIDDNPNNLAEAKAFVPGIQVADETFIERILCDSRFKGKDDRNLSRLNQYKLLEKRKSDEAVHSETGGGNEDFLHQCDVRVFIEHDIEGNIDRAIELVNRTNQLNFTKIRLPEDLGEARNVLRGELATHHNQCGLVRVVDNYGDYGFVGFYVLQQSTRKGEDGNTIKRLKHYCFSCRTLGMKVEKWLYDGLGKPDIEIKGEVLTDIKAKEAVTWVRQISSLNEASRTVDRIADEIRVHGSCEANAVAHYLAPLGNSISVMGNFHAGKSFFRLNSAEVLLSMCDRNERAFEEECQILGAPLLGLTSNIFSDVPENTLFMIGTQRDVFGAQQLVHKVGGWRIVIEPHGFEGKNPVLMSEDEIRTVALATTLSVEDKEEIINLAMHLKNNYETVKFGDYQQFSDVTGRLLNRVPKGARVIFIADHNRVRISSDSVVDAPWQVAYEQNIRRFVSGIPYADVVSFREVIKGDEEIRIGGNHYDRMVYYRLSQRIVEVAGGLRSKI